jgi:hypothetical protein
VVILMDQPLSPYEGARVGYVRCGRVACMDRHVSYDCIDNVDPYEKDLDDLMAA